MSCIDIMRRYYDDDPLASFGSVAADDLSPNTDVEKPNKRFRFYRRMMLTMFSPNLFVQYADVRNSVYILVNKEMLRQGVVTVRKIETELSDLYLGEYSLISY